MKLTQLELAAAVITTTLFLAATVCAAEAPKRQSQPEESTHAPLMASAPAPQFPLASERAGSDCQDLSALAEQMLAFVNADRLDPANQAETGGHALPLKWDPRLAQVALAHAQDMIARHYFSHYDPGGQSPVERFYRVGIQWRSMGENIAKNATVASAEAAFMNEPRFQPNHRGNILNQKFNYVGIGIARGPDGSLYITQDFAKEE
ncbi:MAG: CAP domain-containing protein [Terriglobia bacterium]